MFKAFFMKSQKQSHAWEKLAREREKEISILKKQNEGLKNLAATHLVMLFAKDTGTEITESNKEELMKLSREKVDSELAKLEAP